MTGKRYVDAEKGVKAALLGGMLFMMGLSLWLMEGDLQWRLLRVGLFVLVGWSFYRSTERRAEQEDERAQQIARMSGHLTRYCAILTVLVLWVATLPYDRPLRGWVWPFAMLLVLSWPDTFFRWYLGLRREDDGSLGARALRVAGAVLLVAGTLFVGAQLLVVKNVLESFGFGWADLFFERVDERSWQPSGERDPEGAHKSIYEMTDAELAARGIRRVPKAKGRAAAGTEHKP